MAEILANRRMKSKGHRQFLEFQRHMSKKTRQQLRLRDDKGYEYLNLELIAALLQEYYADVLLELDTYRCLSSEAKLELC